MRKAFWLLLLCLAVHGCKQNNHGSQNLPTTQVSESEKEIVSKEMIADLNKKGDIFSLYAFEIEAAPADNCYFLYDIMGNGIPELFVEHGDCEANFNYECYTYVNGDIKKIGDLNGGHTTFFGGKGYILGRGCQMDYEWCSKYTYKHGGLSESLLYEERPLWKINDTENEYDTNDDVELSPIVYEKTKEEKGAKKIDSSYNKSLHLLRKVLGMENSQNSITCSIFGCTLGQSTISQVEERMKELGMPLKKNKGGSYSYSSKDGIQLYGNNFDAIYFDFHKGLLMEISLCEETDVASAQKKLYCKTHKEFSENEVRIATCTEWPLNTPIFHDDKTIICIIDNADFLWFTLTNKKLYYKEWGDKGSPIISLIK